MSNSIICQSCRAALRRREQIYGALKRTYTRPSFAPKPIIDLKHIRQNPGLYQQNCIDRNYPGAAENSWRILELHEQLSKKQEEVLEVRRRNNALGKEIQRQAGMGDNGQGGGAGGVSALLEEARALKEDLQKFERREGEVTEEMMALAIELPNLSSQLTPTGEEPMVLEYINGEIPPAALSQGGRSHVDIGKELDILDFEASATTSGWGWYFLKNEGALLEQALIQYALEVAIQRGWRVMTPPSLVYEHIASACGFLPRDQNGETQRYGIANGGDCSDSERPNLVLAGTAEIPFAGSQARKTLKASDLPLKVFGPSRSYRAEAGARGVDTKGLYRVHEFTKVEMFAWTSPKIDSEGEGRFAVEMTDQSQTEVAFDEMLSIQRQILTDLGLHAKVLEMPTTDLGASASRKVDMEAFFPSRTSINGGYGELTSASICTDYQSRRLATRVKHEGAKLSFPHTLNGTAMAIPRVLACILENGWDERSRTVTLPECVRKWMPGGIRQIGPATREKSALSRPRV